MLQIDTPLEGDALPAMTIDEFIDYGLEHGQKALLWDFEKHRYVTVLKEPTSVFSQLAGRMPLLSITMLTLVGGLMQ